MNYENDLMRICADRARHARFANTLSLLEYIGARKILKSQRAETFSADLLSHVGEEIRHSQLLKKLALRLSDGELASFEDEHLLCGAEARLYIQSVDRGAAAVLERESASDVWLNYLYTTLLIEERARDLYPHYERVLGPLGQASVVQAILKDELGHLREVLEDLQGHPAHDERLLDPMRATETRAFERFWQALLASCRFTE